MTNPTDRRQAVIDGLRSLADFLTENPDLPIDGSHGFQYSVSAFFDTEAERRAEVERIAALLGVTPVDDDHYVANRFFGPIEYRTVAIPEELRRRYRAERSYAGSVEPEAVSA